MADIINPENEGDLQAQVRHLKTSLIKLRQLGKLRSMSLFVVVFRCGLQRAYTINTVATVDR